MDPQIEIKRGIPIVNGIYVKGSVNTVKVLYTLDTGASCSLLSTKVYEKLAPKYRPKLQKSNLRIIGAGGSYLKCKGEGSFKLQLGPLEIERSMIVAEITDEVLLGADILMSEEGDKADILLSQGIMTLQGKTIPLEQKYNLMGARRVQLADNYVLPAMSEVIADVFVERKESDVEYCSWIIEPCPMVAEKYSVAMASSLVNPNDKVTVQIRLMNPFLQTLTLNQDTTMGYASPVEEVNIIVQQENMEDTENFESIRQIQFKERTDHVENQEHIYSDIKLKEIADSMPSHLAELFNETSEKKTEEEVNKIAKLLKDYQDVFSTTDTDLGLTYLTEHIIDTEQTRPIKQRPRPVPLAFADEDKKAVTKLIAQGSIRPSTSPWASPMVFVRKKDGQIRPCIDYRKLNSITKKDAFPLPRTRDCLDAVAGAKLFSSLDITSAYNQIPVNQDDIAKTAFVTKYGLFEYTTMPFGLCNAPATFQRLMEVALAGLQWTTCLIYLDDVLIFGKTFLEQISRIEAILQKIRIAGLKLKPSKCHLLKERVTFLGHVLSPDGIQPNMENVEKILRWNTPKTVKEVQSFLGMGNYYRRFIQNYSALVGPMTDLTKKGQKFIWNEKCEEAFHKLKTLLTNSPLMAHPQDCGGFILDTDACDVSIGAVLSQIQNGEEKIIAYGSKSLDKCERNYCVTDRELLAVRYFTEHYRSYLLGRKFLIRTDHQALRWLFTMKEPKSRIARWIESLSEFNFEIEHRSGIKHGNADGMSRCPNPWNCNCKNFEQLKCGPCSKCQRKNELMEGKFPETIHDPGKTTQDIPIRVARESLRNKWPLKVTPKEMEKKQMEDPDITLVHKWVKEGKRPSAIQISTASPTTRHYVLNWDSLVISDGVLQRRFHRKDGTSSHLQVVVPKNLQKDVLYHLHNTILSGHLGEKKTREKILQRFYWFGVRNDVITWVRRCDNCKMMKGPAKNQKAPLGSMTTGAPWDRLSTDILGPLPESNRGNKYIMVVTDYFTKWVEIFALPDQQAETCADILMNDVIARYGCPYDLHSDQGRNYMSNIFSEMCKYLEIRKTRTTPYHPSGNGQVERFNRTLIRMIKAYLKGEQKDWDKHLGCLAGAYRASKHESTGFTPNFLMFGKEVRLPAELMYCPPPGEKISSYGEYVTELQNKLERAHSVARKHLETTAERQRESYDAKSTLQKYKAGDLVWYASFAEDSKLAPKFRRKFMGPVMIYKKFNDLTFQILLNKKKDKRTVHHDKLLPYQGVTRPKWAKLAIK